MIKSTRDILKKMFTQQQPVLKITSLAIDKKILNIKFSFKIPRNSKNAA